jgi:tetratricopeptide (TPR) repeat protein
VALRLVSRLWRMWQMRGHLAEGMERISKALALSTIPSTRELSELRADALEAAGGLAYWRGDVAETGRWYEEALAARRALGDRSGIAEALYNLSFAFSLVKPETAAIDLAKARNLAEEASAMFRTVADASGEARALWLLASIDMAIADFESADAKATRAEEVFRRLDDRYYLGWALWAKGVARIGMNRLNAAQAPITEALRIFAEADDVSGASVLLDSTAILALRNGERRRAALLAGAVHAVEATTTLDANALTRAVLHYDPGALQGAEDTRAAWAEGEAMGLEAAIQMAMSDLHKPSGTLDARVQ